MEKVEIGSVAPAFKALDAEGKEYTLNDFKGKKLVLFFYPKDMTPGCTNQVCNLRDHYEELQDMGIELLGVSIDDKERHKKFIEKHQLPFPLLEDPEKIILNTYGVWGPKKFMGREFDGTHRTTFLIDEEGKVVHRIDRVKTKDHAAQIKEFWS
ncbi:MAG TPA: thioredoxin-dependent thiol peroxidase [Chitinophagaceae bacterium]|nr:thioredoxin-dependent thiol peroxidase [Chitinophagaceae bacterium]